MHRLADGESVDAPFERRLLAVSAICEAFHCLPSEAEHELETDPDRLALLILEVRAYLDVKRAFDGAKNIIDDLKHLNGNPHMSLVETHTFELHEERIAHFEEERRQRHG